MKGLELSERYYLEIGKPMLQKAFPSYLHRIAAGLAGDGSECLGYDDSISTDHDFGPGFCLWLDEPDYRIIGSDLQRAYQQLPGSFRGYSARQESFYGGNRVGVMEISEFYSRFIGWEQPPESMIRWLSLPEDKLALATSGRVFEDPYGKFSQIRRKISYYPEDVRVKKIAAKTAKMAQSGQYNYGRCMRRGDTAAAYLALNEFIRHTISMVYLLNRHYMPYYKWMYRGLLDLPNLKEVSELILELMETESQNRAWTNPDTDAWNTFINRADRKVQLIEEICRLIAGELKRQELISQVHDYLGIYPEEIMTHIQDDELRNLPALVE